MVELDVIISDDDKLLPAPHLPPPPPPPGYTPRVFTVRIKKAALINMEQLSKFLSGQLPYTPVDALQAVDVLMRQRPSMLLTTVGRSFFTRNDSKLLGNGAECWMGFHQSVRPAKGKLLVNVDVSATAFYEPGMGGCHYHHYSSPISRHHHLPSSSSPVIIIFRHHHLPSSSSPSSPLIHHHYSSRPPPEQDPCSTSSRETWASGILPI